jgi:tyrosyl-tRNA synthetase
MSKSLGNHVGIAEAPEEQFGKLMSIGDDLLPEYLRLATGWEPAEVDAVVATLEEGPAARVAAKRRLARAVCDLYHGAGAGEAAEAAFDRVFREHRPPEVLPVFSLRPGELDPGGTVRLSRLLAAAGLAASNREGARKIEEGAVRIDGEVVRDDREVPATALDGRTVQVGRRQWARVVLDAAVERPAGPGAV